MHKKRWRLRAIVALVLAVLISFFIGPLPANAQPGGTTTVRSVLYSKCLDSNSLGQVYVLPCNGGNYQAWYGSAGYRIVDYATGRCLNTNYSGYVNTVPCNGSNYQNWYLSGLTGLGTIGNAQTGLCLASNSTTVWATTCSGAGGQTGWWEPSVQYL